MTSTTRSLGFASLGLALIFVLIVDWMNLLKHSTVGEMILLPGIGVAAMLVDPHGFAGFAYLGLFIDVCGYAILFFVVALSLRLVLNKFEGR